MLNRNSKNASAVQKPKISDLDITILASNDEEMKQQRNAMLQGRGFIDAFFNTVVLVPKKESAEQEAAFTDQLKAIFAKFQLNLNVHDKEFKDTCLMRAIRLSRLTGVQRMLRMGADPNYKTTSNVTALFMLTGHDNIDLEILDELMQNGADPSVASIDNQYPIMNFASNCSPKILPAFKRFIEYSQVNVNIKSPENYNAVYAAASLGNAKTLQLLIEKGADVNVTSHRNETALLTAAEHKHWGCVEILLKNKADPNIGMVIDNTRPEEKLTPLLMVLDRFIGANLPAEKVILINIFRLLIRSGADPFLVCRNKLSVFDFMFNEAFKKHLDIVLEANLDFNKPCNENGETPLILACKYRNESAVDALLKKKVDATIPSKNGLTALHFAADKQTSLVAKLFPACLPILNLNVEMNNFTTTALRMACESGNDKVVRLLLEKGANPRLPLERQVTLLHIAAGRGFINIVKLLISRLDINAQMDDGATPLFFAAQEGYLEIVTTLCEAGADYKINRADRQTILGIAYKYNHTAVVNYFMRQLSNEYTSQVRSIFAGFRIECRIVKEKDYTPQLLADAKKFEESNVGMNAIAYELCVVSDEQVTQAHEPDSVSGRVFLKNKYSPEEFEELMRATSNVDDSVESSESDELTSCSSSSTVSWMGGAITLADVKPIEGQLKSRHCYLYLDDQTLLKQGCANFAAFSNMLLKHAPKVGAAGLVKIKGKHSIEVTCGDITTTEELSYELKITNSPDRILCFRRRADGNNPHSLIVACVSVEGGLHTTNAIKSLPTKVTVNLPANTADKVLVKNLVK